MHFSGKGSVDFTQLSKDAMTQKSLRTPAVMGRYGIVATNPALHCRGSQFKSVVNLLL